MKLPPFIASPLKVQPGVPSPALLRAAAVWPDDQRASQMAAVQATAGCSPPRFFLLATVTSSLASLPTAAVLAELLPGRAAVVMTPQIDPAVTISDQTQLAAALLRALDEPLRDHGILLSQALTPKRTDETTQQFLAAGYQIASDLLYLGADLTSAATRRISHPLQPLELLPHSPADFERWIPLIERTYEKTLDCPAVDGLRPTRDVLIGYRDIGIARDDWWFIARYNDQDVGCLLLADHRPAAHAELVYMGLTPEMRGRGWGVYLAHQAQQIAATTGAEHLVLSVDAENLPALRHYQSAGFHFWEQRTILMKSLR